MEIRKPSSMVLFTPIPEFYPSYSQSNATDTSTDHGGISTMRDASPAHYTLKIQSFSLLSKASIEKFDSENFEAGGYKWCIWKLSFYPNGNKIGDGEDHISLYLALVETSSLPSGWEVNAIISFFVYNQFQDKYLTFPDGIVRRFHAVKKTEWGIPKFMDHNTFKNPSNGYLVDDTCAFGVEVFVIKGAAKGECLSMVEEAVTRNHTWRTERLTASGSVLITNISGYTYSEVREHLSSSRFIAGGYEWHIKLYPKGTGDGNGNSVSLFLCVDTSLHPGTKIYAKYSLSVMEQISNIPFEEQACHCFSASSSYGGWSRFVPLDKFNDSTKRFRGDDTACIIEAQVTVLGSVTNL